MSQTNNPLRMADLIAKAARVTLKDTMRVLLALEAVAEHSGVGEADVLGSVDFNPSRPNAEQVAACESAFYELKNANRDGIKTRMRGIRDLM